MSNHTTYASSPGMLRIDEEKYDDLIEFMKLNKKQQIKLNEKRNMIADHLFNGDTMPAIVVSTNPLIISSYSDELDAVVMLEFPKEYQQKYQLQENMRLVTINGYTKSLFGRPKDIKLGYRYLHRWTNVYPTVGLFLSNNIERINQLIENVPEPLWDYVKELSDEYIQNYKFKPRKGFWFI